MPPWVGELYGTALLILLGNGVVANVVLPKTKGADSGWIVITFGWGMAVFVAVWCCGALSGAHINPAVTLGLAAAGKFDWADVPAYMTAQMIGGFLGAVLVWVVYRDHYRDCEDGDAQLASFCNAPAIRNTLNNFLCEAIGTSVLVFAVLSAVDPSIDLPLLAGALDSGADPPKLGLGTIGALPVGLLVFAIGLSLGGPTGYAINPARDLSPRIAHAVLPLSHKRDSDWGYALIPVLGPCAGAVAAALLYGVVAAA